MLRTVTLLVCLGPLAGCQTTQGEPATATCEGLARRLRQCEPGFSTPTERFVARCRRIPTDMRGFRRCVSVDDCGAFRRCVRTTRERSSAARREARMAPLMDDVRDAIRAGDWDAVEAACLPIIDDMDPSAEARAFCADVPQQAVLALSREFEALRTQPSAPQIHWARCEQLRRFAGRLGPKARQRADERCARARIALEAEPVLVEVRARVLEREPRLVLGCEPLLERLESAPIRDEALERRVVEACFGALGRVVLAATHDTAQACPIEARRLIAAVTRYGVVDSVVQDGVRRLRSVCTP